MSFFDDLFSGLPTPQPPRTPVFHLPKLPVIIPTPAPRPAPRPAPVAAPTNPFRIPIAPKKKKEKTASDVFIEHIVERTGEVVQEVVEEVGAPIRRTAEAVEQGVRILSGDSDPTTRETMTHTEPKKKKKKKSTITDTTDEDRTEATEERPVDTRPTAPPTQPHAPDPTDNTGEQVPDSCNNPTGGNQLLVINDSCHRENHDPYSGGGMHSGGDGSKTHASTEGVEHFDTGQAVVGLSRRDNPTVQMMNLINSLKDPFGEFRTCQSEKRLVE